VGDRLGVRVPGGSLTAEQVAYIREHKDDLLALIPVYPIGPPAAVEAAVARRAAALRAAGRSVVAAELQAAEEVLGLADGVETSARCDFHGCAQRRLPDSDLYRCPACVPGAFAQRRAG
jgi:hypothetical protein